MPQKLWIGSRPPPARQNSITYPFFFSMASLREEIKKKISFCLEKVQRGRRGGGGNSCPKTNSNCFVHVWIFIKKGGGDYPMPHILRNFSSCVWKKIREGWEQPNSKILRHLLTDLGLLREMCHLSHVICQLSSVIFFY